VTALEAAVTGEALPAPAALLALCRPAP
jgi:hypothetical protein